MPRSLFTVIFWKDAIDRAVSTGAGSAVAAWTLGLTGIVPSMPSPAVLVAFGAGAGLDLLRSLSTLRVDNGTASPLAEVVAVQKAEDDKAER